MSPIWNAARLVYKGLAPRQRPIMDEEYRELIKSHEADETFREQVRDIADAMGLAVLDVSSHGIVLAPRPESRFATTAAEYRAKVSIEDRGLIALIQVAVAATFFPTAASLEFLERASEVTATAGRIRENLQTLCRGLEKRFTADPAAVPLELEEGWRIVLRKPSVRDRAERDDERARRAATGDLDGLVQIVLKNLVDNGMLRREDTQREPFYLPTRRYRVHLREMAANEIFDLCHRIAATVEVSEVAHAAD